MYRNEQLSESQSHHRVGTQSRFAYARPWIRVRVRTARRTQLHSGLWRVQLVHGSNRLSGVRRFFRMRERRRHLDGDKKLSAKTNGAIRGILFRLIRVWPNSVASRSVTPVASATGPSDRTEPPPAGSVPL